MCGKKSGMTLIEMVVAISIFLVISSFAGVRIRGFIHRTKTASAEASLEAISLGISMMKSDTGQYPRELSDLSRSLMPNYISLPARYWNGPYIPGFSLTDPWGEPYSYELLRQTSSSGAEVFGPYQFSTETYDYIFSALPGSGTLVIENTFTPPLNRGTILINGTEIASDSDFSGRHRVEKNIVLEETNTISLDLRNPGAPRTVVIAVKGGQETAEGEPMGFRLGSPRAGISITGGLK